ncbi:MAG: Rrf2 family transcriptional regulator [Bdellovibrionales bacterium]|nr:Rrf2 family transcriptional regulator [Bdellovibrionales bacterium]
MVDTRFTVSVHMMTSLAYHRQRLLSSELLAEGIKTNASFIRKLVTKLSAAGLVESVRGKSGGIRLAKNPKDVTLDQIYKAVVDSTLIAVPTKSPQKSCKVSCGIGSVLCKISDEIEEGTLKQLSKTTLQAVLDDLKG